MYENKPYFSVIIPLYNKQNYIKKTIETVLTQTFQNFEILVVNDGSQDDSLKIVEGFENNRIRIINQKNQGVSVARNNGIKEAKANYIAFLDADDIWLPQFLQTIHQLTIDFPEAGIYATSYEFVNNIGKHKQLNTNTLPSKDYIGFIPNYFKSVALGDLLVCTSAVCIPRNVFIKNDIWFPIGEKYGEDQYVWGRIAMQFEVAYNTKNCASYMTETQNNTRNSILKEKEPHKCILNLEKFKSELRNKEKIEYFDKYIENHILMFINLNINNNQRKYALNQVLKYNISIKNKFKLLFLICTPFWLHNFLRTTKKIIKRIIK